MAQQLDIPMPRFGRANNGPTTGETWGDTDNFDVDMLAEYLLDDGNLGSGVTFDFNIEHANQGSLVSPENSEDGNMPPMAEMPAPTPIAASSAPQALLHLQHAQIPGQQQYILQHQQHVQQPMMSTAGISLVPATMSAPVSVLAPAPVQATFSTLQNPIPNLALQNPIPNLATAPLVASNFMAVNLTTASLASVPGDAHQMIFQQQGNAPKRRRVDAAGAAAPTVATGVHLLNEQQLVAATASQATPPQVPSRKKSQAQVARRRERNRILARRTRLRKKFFFESLQKDVMDLQRENLRLKDIVKTNINEVDSKKILDDCDALERMPPSVLEACGETGDDMDSKDFNLVSSIQKSQHSFIITDPSLQDNPIVFASDDFLKLTGYSRDQVLGRNCRFLQGTDTHQAKVEHIRKGLANGDDVSVTLLNYKCDGTPFWNKLFIAALRDAQNNIVNYIGVTVEVASPEPNDPEHGKVVANMKNPTTMDGNNSDEDAEDTVRAIEDSVSAAVAAAAN